MKMTVNSMKCFSWSRLAIFTAAMTVLSSCGGGQSGMKLGDDEFTVVAVQSTASQQSTSYPATIKGVQDIEVRPQVSGFIVKLCVDEGATVKKGQGTLSDRSYTVCGCRTSGKSCCRDGKIECQYADFERTTEEKFV